MSSNNGKNTSKAGSSGGSGGSHGGSGANSRQNKKDFSLLETGVKLLRMSPLADTLAVVSEKVGGNVTSTLVADTVDSKPKKGDVKNKSPKGSTSTPTPSLLGRPAALGLNATARRESESSSQMLFALVREAIENVFSFLMSLVGKAVPVVAASDTAAATVHPQGQRVHCAVAISADDSGASKPPMSAGSSVNSQKNGLSVPEPATTATSSSSTTVNPKKQQIKPAVAAAGGNVAATPSLPSGIGNQKQAQGLSSNSSKQSQQQVDVNPRNVVRPAPRSTATASATTTPPNAPATTTLVSPNGKLDSPRSSSASSTSSADSSSVNASHKLAPGSPGLVRLASGSSTSSDFARDEEWRSVSYNKSAEKKTKEKKVPISTPSAPVVASGANTNTTTTTNASPASKISTPGYNARDYKPTPPLPAAAAASVVKSPALLPNSGSNAKLKTPSPTPARKLASTDSPNLVPKRSPQLAALPFVEVAKGSSRISATPSPATISSNSEAGPDIERLNGGVTIADDLSILDDLRALSTRPDRIQSVPSVVGYHRDTSPSMVTTQANVNLIPATAHHGSAYGSYIPPGPVVYDGHNGPRYNVSAFPSAVPMPSDPNYGFASYNQSSDLTSNQGYPNLVAGARGNGVGLVGAPPGMSGPRPAMPSSLRPPVLPRAQAVQFPPKPPAVPIIAAGAATSSSDAVSRAALTSHQTVTAPPKPSNSSTTLARRDRGRDRDLDSSILSIEHADKPYGLSPDAPSFTPQSLNLHSGHLPAAPPSGGSLLLGAGIASRSQQTIGTRFEGSFDFDEVEPDEKWLLSTAGIDDDDDDALLGSIPLPSQVVQGPSKVSNVLHPVGRVAVTAVVDASPIGTASTAFHNIHLTSYCTVLPAAKMRQVKVVTDIAGSGLHDSSAVPSVVVDLATSMKRSMAENAMWRVTIQVPTNTVSFKYSYVMVDNDSGVWREDGPVRSINVASRIGSSSALLGGLEQEDTFTTASFLGSAISPILSKSRGNSLSEY